MSRVAAMLSIMRRQAGRSGVVVAWGQRWAWGSVVAFLMTLGLVLAGEAALGDLDPMAGGGGTVTTDFGGTETATALVLQPDGKLVAAGIFDAGGIGSEDFILARYLSDGRLDPTFGIGGMVTTDFGGSDVALALILQPDGKLVAAGQGGSGGGFIRDFILARYLPDGRLDPAFGAGGKVTTDFGGNEAAGALVLQPDGKLVAAGDFEEVGVRMDFALARYLPDGRLDPTFGIGGMVTTDTGGGNGIRALVLQPDGKLVAAGLSNGITLARYLPDGRLDPSFGDGGLVTTDVGDSEDVGALVLQPDGKLVAAGVVDFNVAPKFFLVRSLPDGSLDPTFGMGGTVTTDFGGGAGAGTLVLQPEGKLVVAGVFCPVGIGVNCDFALARYLPDGSLDPTFGVGGTVTTDFGDSDWALALVLQPDGKLVAAGRSEFPGGNNTSDFALARYLPDGLLDATFGTGFEINVNALVGFDPIPSTFTFTPDPTGCLEGFVGTFSFEARLTNISESALTDLAVAVTTLTNGNLLQNADGGPGGVGARLTVPPQDGFSEGVLSPEEFVDVPFVICLTQQQPFTFVVDVLGVVEAGADEEAKAPLVP